MIDDIPLLCLILSHISAIIQNLYIHKRLNIRTSAVRTFEYVRTYVCTVHNLKSEFYMSEGKNQTSTRQINHACRHWTVLIVYFSATKIM